MTELSFKFVQDGRNGGILTGIRITFHILLISDMQLVKLKNDVSNVVSWARVTTCD